MDPVAVSTVPATNRFADIPIPDQPGPAPANRFADLTDDSSGQGTIGEVRPWYKTLVDSLSAAGPAMAGGQSEPGGSGFVQPPTNAKESAMLLSGIRQGAGSGIRTVGALASTEGGPAAMLTNSFAEKMAQIVEGSKDNPGAVVQAGILALPTLGSDVSLARSALTMGTTAMAAQKAGDLVNGNPNTPILSTLGTGATVAAIPYAIKISTSPVVKVANILAGNKAAPFFGTATRDASAAEARAAGYIIPESGSTVDSVIQWLGGKKEIGRKARELNSVNNQTATAVENRMDPKVAELTSQEMDKIKADAWTRFYAPVAQSGVTIKPDNIYRTQMNDIMAASNKAAQGFPGAFKNDVGALIGPLAKPQSIGIDLALSGSQELRKTAKADFLAGRSDIGNAKIAAAKTIEDQIERSLTAGGKSGTDLLGQYKQGRQQMAIANATDEALRQGGGATIPSSFGRQLQAGVPLSGGIRAQGLMANNFAQYSAELGRVPGKAENPLLKTSVSTGLAGLGALGGGAAGYSLGGYAGAAGGAALGSQVGKFLGTGVTSLARPAIRSAVLSKPYQTYMAANGTLDPAIANQISKFVTLSAVQARQREVTAKTAQVGSVLNNIATKANPEAPAPEQDKPLAIPPPYVPPSTSPVITLPESVKVKAPLSATTIKVSDPAAVAKLDKLLAAQNPTESPAEQAATKAKEKKTYVLSNIRRDGNKIIGATVEVA